MMDFGHRSGNETGNGGLLDSGDPRIRKVVKATSEHLGHPKLPVASGNAHREHAIAAFGKTAADETVKPSNECISTPFTVGFRLSAAGQATSLSKALPQTRTLARGKSARIAIKAKGRILFLDTADVIAVEARGNYVSLLHISSSHTLRESISTMEAKLNFHGFVRIHRSVLVNAALVEEIHPRFTGEYVLRLRGGREFTVTRTYKNNLQLLAQLWFGMEGFASE
jgi:two-component system LytT family response regulator